MATMTGVVTIVQEGRFQLTDNGGVSHFFLLSARAAAETAQLSLLQHQQSWVRVHYTPAANLIGYVAHTIEIGDQGAGVMEVNPRAREIVRSQFDGPIPNESELTAHVRIEPGKSYGFFTDTTVCIGCKACEVACKEWNNLPADSIGLTGQSYDNTGSPLGQFLAACRLYRAAWEGRGARRAADAVSERLADDERCLQTLS